MRGSVVNPSLAGTGITVLILIRTLSPCLTMLLHSAHRLIGDVADHRLDQIELLAGVIGRLAEIGVRMSDRYGGFGWHLTSPFELLWRHESWHWLMGNIH